MLFHLCNITCDLSEARVILLMRKITKQCFCKKSSHLQIIYQKKMALRAYHSNSVWPDMFMLRFLGVQF